MRPAAMLGTQGPARQEQLCADNALSNAMLTASRRFDIHAFDALPPRPQLAKLDNAIAQHIDHGVMFRCRKHHVVRLRLFLPCCLANLLVTTACIAQRVLSDKIAYTMRPMRSKTLM